MKILLTKKKTILKAKIKKKTMKLQIVLMPILFQLKKRKTNKKYD